MVSYFIKHRDNITSTLTLTLTEGSRQNRYAIRGSAFPNVLIISARKMQGKAIPVTGREGP
jgi:hypothetical protein